VAGFRFTVKDITPSAIKNSPSNASRRGTALITFRAQVPALFRDIMRSSESQILNIHGDMEPSMEVDSKFIGATQLYEQPPGTDIIAEYAVGISLLENKADN